MGRGSERRKKVKVRKEEKWKLNPNMFSSKSSADMIKARTYDVFLSFRGKDTRDGFLVKIMDCNKCVVPVFYGVDPSDVRKQRGSFADAFAKHEENFKHDLEKLKTWRTALTSAANLFGWDSHVTR
ncbi:toll/interleukin-1 receptor-like protein [Gossypium raimondii]|uniref:toll/interleukin-1 receptor-like protein n=1 Tax=Gossypium raimondii TaxID=29730 RepID=UPI00227A5F26|nr:toll/interleukin-1 receptor-like protein [Gossypium raimondii]